MLVYVLYGRNYSEFLSKLVLLVNFLIDFGDASNYENVTMETVVIG